MPSKYEFDPDYAVPPGATLHEILDSMSLSQSDLAARTGLTEKTISQIINGAAALSYETASKLELVLGVPASFWNARESNYREALLRLEEAKQLADEKEWLDLIPVKELISRQAIVEHASKAETVREVFKFFQVSSVPAWNKVWLTPQVKFRGGKTQIARPGYAAAWVRLGETYASKINCAPYDENKFRAALGLIRGMMCEPLNVWVPKVKALCAEAGVAFVLVKEIPGGSISGATQWLGKDKAVIMLSLKYKSDDQFWFSFFHEACHVLKHSKKKTFYEIGKAGDSPEEKEANQFAADLLIPPKFGPRLFFLKSKVAIIAFANELGIPPGIVVGRLQHDNILKPKFCNDLRRTYEWE